MNEYAIISLIAAVISFFIANFIYFRNPRNSLNRLIAILSALVSFMALDEFVYRLLETAGAVSIWLKISTLWPLIPSLLLHIALVFTNRNQILEKKWGYLLIYGPSVIFVLIGLSSNLLIGPPVLEYWGWTYSIPTERFIYDLFSLWTVIVSFLAGALVFLYYFHTEGMEKKESLYISIGLFMPLIFSLVTDFILKEVSIKVPEFTQTLLSIGLLFIAFGVWKYNFPLLTPTLAAEKIISTMPNFLILSDQYGNITKVNDSILNNLGYKEKEILGKPYYSLFAEENQEIMKNAIQDGNLHMETKILAANGDSFEVLLSVSHIYSILTEATGMVIIGTDLSEIKKAQKQIMESESKFKSVIEQTSDGVSLADARGKIIYWNKSIESITGISHQEAMEMHWYDVLYHLMSPEKKEGLIYHDIKKYFENVLKTGKMPSCLELEEKQIIRPDNSEKTIQSFNFFVEGTNEPLVCSVVRDITQSKEDEAQLKLSLQEKDVLLREIHHRVKNNLQIISSLLNLQSGYVKDKEDLNLFKESQNRVKSMAMIHENLYQSRDLAFINFSTYISRLTTELFASYGVDSAQINLKKEVESIELDINTAIPCGLIINEIISNCIKYAFPDGRKGQITVSFKQLNDKYQLIIGDNGIGFPPEIDFRNTTSLGMKLVTSLVDQLDGEISLDSSSGTCFTIEFKELEYEPRL